MKPMEFVVPSIPLEALSPRLPAQLETWDVAAESAPQALLQDLLQRWGTQSSAYFNLQPQVRHFIWQNVGFLSYAPQWTPWGRVNLIFTNPVVAPAALAGLVQRFREQVKGDLVFMGVDRDCATILERLGYRCNGVGTEFAVPLKGFDVGGKQKKQLRHAANLGGRYNLEVRELPWAEVDADEVQRLSEAWRDNKAVRQRELRLLTRPPVFGGEWGVRKFFCYQEGRLLGYIFFDPYYSNGQIQGYCANILRTWPGAKPSGLLDYILLEAIKTFQAEGVAWVSLGIAPLHGIQALPGDRALVRRIQQFLYTHGNRLYAFQALAYHKSRYRGDENTWYLCTHGTNVLKLTWALCRGTGLLAL